MPSIYKSIQQKHILQGVNALKVFATDPKIRQWLLQNDPQAYKQCITAVEALEQELEPLEPEEPPKKDELAQSPNTAGFGAGAL